MDIKKSVEMAGNFARAMASRGVKNKKIEPYTKQLRVLSCFGNQHDGGELPPCEHLKNSKTQGKYFCGGCGCGDRKSTWLLSNNNEYSKLDYPSLSCPLKMPGFSDYSPSSPEDAIPPVTRKYYIENVPEEIVNKVEITNPGIPENMEPILVRKK